MGTDKLDNYLDMLTGADELPPFRLEDWDWMEAKLRSTTPAQLFTATWLLWCDWTGRRGKFWVYFKRNADRALRFVRLVDRTPENERELSGYLLLFAAYQTLERIGRGDALAYEMNALADLRDVLLANWPAYGLQKRQQARDAVEADLARMTA